MLLTVIIYLDFHVFYLRHLPVIYSQLHIFIYLQLKNFWKKKDKIIKTFDTVCEKAFYGHLDIYKTSFLTNRCLIQLNLPSSAQAKSHTPEISDIQWFAGAGRGTCCVGTLPWLRHPPTRQRQISHEEVLKSVSKLQIINRKGRKLRRASAKVVLLCKTESMGRKAMGRGEWPKLIKPSVSGFRAVLTSGVLKKFSFCLCVLPKDCLGQKQRILLLPGI